MTKTLFSLIPPPLRSICIIALILSLCACSLVNDLTSERASLSFTITGELAERLNSASRARSATLADIGLYLDIALEGDYEDEKTISVSEGSTVKFENIPTGLSVYATAQAYEMDGGEKFVFYEGESEKITIQEGENALSLFLQKVESDIIRYYISANAEAGGNGSKAKPFLSIISACQYDINDSSKTYWLIVEGTLENTQTITTYDDDYPLAAKRIVIKGSTGAKIATNGGTCLHIETSIPVTIENITITNGNGTQGGGINISQGANVTIAEGTIITGNQSISGDCNGGGIYNRGTLTITGGEISNNEAFYGAGIYNSGIITISGGTIKNNTASYNGGGIFIDDGECTMTGGSIKGNNAENGGGIYLQTGSLTINSGTFSGNSASSYGNTIYKGLNGTINSSTDELDVYYAE